VPRTSSHRTRIPAFVFLATLSLIAAGCGGSDSTKTTIATASGTAVALPDNTIAPGTADASAKPTDSLALGSPTTVPTDPKQAMLAFAKCVRSKGIEIADPDGSGQISSIPTGPGADDAIKACQSFLTAGLGGNQEITDEQRAQILELAKCMRKSGFPDFPDPEISGGGVNLGKGVDVNDPKTRDAMGVCSKSLGIGNPPTT
jgi:hypothetical protein